MNKQGKTALFASVALIVSVIVAGFFASIQPVQADPHDQTSSCTTPTTACNAASAGTSTCTGSSPNNPNVGICKCYCRPSDHQWFCVKCANGCNANSKQCIPGSR